MTSAIARTLLVAGIVGFLWARHEWRALTAELDEPWGDVPQVPEKLSHYQPLNNTGA